MVRRSVLFTPGDEPDMMRKAVSTGADVVVFDLEDAVAPGAKDEAREKVRDILSDNEIKSADPEVCVRVNPLDQRGEEDVVAVTGEEHEPSSIVLPKVGSSKEVEELQDLLSANGSDAYILALIETARGVINSPKIAEVARVDALIFGAEDLSAELGATRTPEGTEVLYAREKVVTAATASGIDAIDTLHTDFRDTEGLREDTEFGIQLGFDGKLAIHPSQVGVINDAFTPDGDRVEWAERVLKAKEEAENKGKGVFEVDGQMIDSPLIKQAETIIERAEAAGVR